ncbi:MAG: hypothetical protein ACK4N5_16575, partial [Myxococcales bacterium]
MKNFLRAMAMLTLAGAAAACQQQEPTIAGNLIGPTSIVQSGRRMLISTREANEVRVLSLEGEQTSFVRAPNPLYPLSVPTAPLPQSLGAWTGPGGTDTAPYALALSTVAAQVSVIDTGTLTLLGSFAVPDTALSVTVTAFAPGSAARGVIAVSQAGQGALYVAQLPPALRDNPAAVAEVQPTLAVGLGASVPQFVLASPTDPDLVAVGDRQVGDDGFGRAGGLVLVNVATGAVERFDVGGPILRLSFEPTGQRVYGILDAEACEGRRCTGVFGFDVGARTLLPGAAAAPVEVPGVLRGVAVGAADTVGGVALEPVVLVSSTDGNLYVVDGGAMRVLDLDPAGASVAETFHLEPDGTRNEVGGGPTNVEVREGAVRTERINVA